MSSSCSDRYPIILKDYLGEDLYERAEERGINDERMMSWYHKLGRDQELFKDRVEEALKRTEAMSQTVRESIENLEKQIETLKQAEKGSIEEMVLFQ